MDKNNYKNGSYWHFTLTIFLIACISAPTFAKTLGIKYGAKSWNKNSKTLDSAHILMRDRTSGRLAKILLEETEPDSSVFAGNFSIDWAGGSKKMDAQIFVPEQNVEEGVKSLEKMTKLIQQDKLKPKPYVLKDDDKKPEIEVFDSEEQAKLARKAYELESAAKKKSEKAELVKPKASDSTLQAAQIAAREAALAKLALDAASREAQRIRMAQLEAQKMEEERKKMAALNAAEKARRQKEAEALAQRAIAAYQKSDFEMAEKLFRQSVALDPDNKANYFMFGVSLYRTEKYDEALVTLKLAKTEGQTNLEKRYYMGLIHFKLKELDQAKAAFREVKVAKHPVLSASAAFYEGLLYFSVEQLEEAKKSFEFVLDESQDPAMDKKAEEYIEKILQIMQYKKMAEKKWFANVKTGFGYDSNILNSPENDDSAGSPSNKGGIRYNLMGDVERRFFFKPDSDFSAKVSSVYMYSLDQDKFGTADPFVITATAPYSRKGTFESKKGYKLGVTPGYETVMMDYDNAHSRTQIILNTLMINTDLQVIMSENWFSGYTLDVRSDDSQLSSTADENADALKVSLKKTETLFLDQSKKRAAIGSLGYVLNSASGDNKNFNRFDLSAMYSAPWERYKNTSWNAGISMYLLNYPDTASPRRDTNIAFNFGVSQVINEKWNWSTTGSIGNNSSNDDNYTYTKYTLLGLLGYSWSE